MMDISKLDSMRLLGGGGNQGILAGLGNASNLAMAHHVASSRDDWGEFPNKVRAQGRQAAQEILEFLDHLPDLAGARGHLHFATGTDDLNMAPAGSKAAEALVRWSDLRSKAVALIGYDFDLLPLHPPDEAKAKFDQMAELLDEDADRFIAERLRFFGVRPG